MEIFSQICNKQYFKNMQKKYKNGRCGMIVNETAIHQKQTKLKPTTAFNNGPESIPQSKL